jgi:ABC-type glycerol-3-phosphate transport system substrate-binding protein
VLSSSLGVGGKPPQTFQKGRTIYGLPKDYSTLALFYNKKAFRSVGRSQLLIAGANYATIWQSNEDLSIVLNNFNN